MIHADEARINPAEIINTTNRLIQIMRSEVKIIDSMRLADLNNFTEEKIKLVEIMEYYKSVMQKNPEKLKDISPAAKEEMLSVLRKFEDLVEVERTQFIKARQVHSYIMNALRSSIKRNIETVVGYAGSGRMKSVDKRLSSTPAMSINESI